MADQLPIPGLPELDTRRADAKARMLARFTDPTTPPFPAAVQLCCDECGRFLVWVNPPLPPHGRTVCRGCS